MKRILTRFLVLSLAAFAHPPAIAADTMRAASGGFTTAIHAVLWAAYEEKLFKKYGLEVEYLAFNSGRLGMQMLLSDEVQVLFSTGVTVVTTNLQKADLAIIAGGSGPSCARNGRWSALAASIPREERAISCWRSASGSPAKPSRG